MKKGKFNDIIKIVIGSWLVVLVITNIHARYKIVEGSQLGVELLFYNWLG